MFFLPGKGGIAISSAALRFFVLPCLFQVTVSLRIQPYQPSFVKRDSSTYPAPTWLTDPAKVCQKGGDEGPDFSDCDVLVTLLQYSDDRNAAKEVRGTYCLIAQYKTCQITIQASKDSPAFLSWASMVEAGYKINKECFDAGSQNGLARSDSSDNTLTLWMTTSKSAPDKCDGKDVNNKIGGIYSYQDNPVIKPFLAPDASLTVGTTNTPIGATPTATTSSPPITTSSPPITTSSPPITTSSPPITTSSPPVTTSTQDTTTTDNDATTTTSAGTDSPAVTTMLSPSTGVTSETWTSIGEAAPDTHDVLTTTSTIMPNASSAVRVPPPMALFLAWGLLLALLAP